MQARLLRIEGVVRQVDLGERGHREAGEHGGLRAHRIEAARAARRAVGERGGPARRAREARRGAARRVAHLSLKRLSSFSRSWMARCLRFDCSRSLSAASIAPHPRRRASPPPRRARRATWAQHPTLGSPPARRCCCVKGKLHRGYRRRILPMRASSRAHERSSAPRNQKLICGSFAVSSHCLSLTHTVATRIRRQQ